MVDGRDIDDPYRCARTLLCALVVYWRTHMLPWGAGLSAVDPIVPTGMGLLRGNTGGFR